MLHHKKLCDIDNNNTYQSRRGEYKLCVLNNKTIEWEPEPMTDSNRDEMVISEVQYALEFRLYEHKYWHDEEPQFIMEYTRLYNELFSLNWLIEQSSRNNVCFNMNCCLSIIQYNNGTLHAYSRSTDMRNGYYSDRRVLDYLAQTIKEKLGWPVNKISWYLACPHVYVKDGIARRKK